MKFLLLLFITPVILLCACLYFWVTGNLTIPRPEEPTEQEYCARAGNTIRQYAPVNLQDLLK